MVKNIKTLTIFIFLVLISMNYASSDSSNLFLSVNVSSGDISPPLIFLQAPSNNSVDPDGDVYVICSATDNIELKNISIKLNNSINQTTLIGGTNNQSNFLLNLSDGYYVISCLAYDTNANFNEAKINIIVNKTSSPMYNTTYFSGNTTNWSSVPDITNVCNGTAILDNPPTDKIVWDNCVNAAGVNFDASVDLAYNNVTVIFGLHNSFNSSATITMRNLPWNETPEILIDGQLCPIDVCQNATYDITTKILVFKTIHFTSFTTQASSRLEIWDETDSEMPYSGLTKYPGNETTFFANYTKSGAPLSGATCTINFADQIGTMSYNTTKKLFEYNRTFVMNGTYFWNVTCSATGAQTLFTNDSVIIAKQIIDTSAPIISNVLNSSITPNSFIVSWITDDLSNTTVTYGTTPSLGNSISNTTLVTNHVLNVNELNNVTTYYYNVTSCNQYGNCSTSGIYAVTTTEVPYIDTIKPSVSLIQPTTANEDVYVNYNATVSDDINVTSCSLYVNGINNGLMSGTPTQNGIVNRSILIADPGNYFLIANCTDAAGNHNDTSLTLITILDNTPPNILLVSPLATTYIYTNITLNISTSDNVAVDSTWYEWNGTNISYSIPILIYFEDNVTITLKAYANDSSNNVGISSVTFLVNTSAAPDIISPGISEILSSTTNTTATISWLTNEAANSTIKFGTTQGLGTIISNATYLTNRTITIYSLLPNTTYYYNVTSCDLSNNCNTSGVYNFTTQPNYDTTAPVISGVGSTSITTNSAHIIWTTNENANGTVKYGLTISFEDSVIQSTYTKSHDLVISGLTNGTMYYYNVTSCDPSGNCATSGIYNFTTLQPTPSSSGGSSGSSTKIRPPACEEDWLCDYWTSCQESGIQTRECVDLNRCGTHKYQPTLSQSCKYKGKINATGNTTQETRNVTTEMPTASRKFDILAWFIDLFNFIKVTLLFSLLIVVVTIFIFFLIIGRKVTYYGKANAIGKDISKYLEIKRRRNNSIINKFRKNLNMEHLEPIKVKPRKTIMSTLNKELNNYIARRHKFTFKIKPLREHQKLDVSKKINWKKLFSWTKTINELNKDLSNYIAKERKIKKEIIQLDERNHFLKKQQIELARQRREAEKRKLKEEAKAIRQRQNILNSVKNKVEETKVKREAEFDKIENRIKPEIKEEIKKEIKKEKLEEKEKKKIDKDKKKEILSKLKNIYYD